MDSRISSSYSDDRRKLTSLNEFEEISSKGARKRLHGRYYDSKRGRAVPLLDPSSVKENEDLAGRLESKEISKESKSKFKRFRSSSPPSSDSMKVKRKDKISREKGSDKKSERKSNGDKDRKRRRKVEDEDSDPGVLKKRKKSGSKRRKDPKSDSSRDRKSKRKRQSDEPAATEEDQKVDFDQPMDFVLQKAQDQKEMVRRSAKIARARLNGGDLDRARQEQEKMQNMFGQVDWRVKKKLKLENKKLQRTISAGNRLEEMEAREAAKMDAFRVAMGLPTAEAERQAKWREEASKSAHVISYNTPTQRSTKKGPRIPKL